MTFLRNYLMPYNNVEMAFLSTVYVYFIIEKVALFVHRSSIKKNDTTRSKKLRRSKQQVSSANICFTYWTMFAEILKRRNSITVQWKYLTERTGRLCSGHSALCTLPRAMRWLLPLVTDRGCRYGTRASRPLRILKIKNPIWSKTVPNRRHNLHGLHRNDGGK